MNRLRNSEAFYFKKSTLSEPVTRLSVCYSTNLCIEECTREQQIGTLFNAGSIFPQTKLAANRPIVFLKLQAKGSAAVFQETCFLCGRKRMFTLPMR